MDMGEKAGNWTDSVQCIPKGAVPDGGIAPGVARTLFQVPVPDRRLLEGADLTNMTIVDSRQLTRAGRMVICHSVATTWVCHAPTMTYFYAVKAKTRMAPAPAAAAGSAGSEEEEVVIDVTVMCHSDSPEEPKEETICHVTGAGDLAIYPTHLETGQSAIGEAQVQAQVQQQQQQTQQQQLSTAGAGDVAVQQFGSPLIFLVIGWVMASAAIAGGFYLGRRRSRGASYGRDGHGVQTAVPVDDMEVEVDLDLDGTGKPLSFV